MPTEQATTAEPITLPEQDSTDTETVEKLKTPPPNAVIVHDDDYNGMDYVVGVFQKVFHYSMSKATILTLEVHNSGRALVWSGSMEVAELKADQVRSCGPDPNMKSKGAMTLKVTIEPLPQ